MTSTRMTMSQLRRCVGRAAAAFPLALAVGCASAARSGEPAGPIADPSAGQPTQATTLVTGTGSYNITAVNDAPSSGTRALRAAPDSAFYALVEVYQGLGMTPNVVVSSSRTVGVREGGYTQRLGKRRLSDFVSCGTDAAGLQLADQYRVTLTALSQVAPGQDGGSLVTTQVSATARNLAQSTDPVRCSSTGRLEAVVNNLAAVQSTR
jgi:hypothetical protein